MTRMHSSSSGLPIPSRRNVVIGVSGGQRADGSGRLSGRRGQAVWSSPTGCAGRWEADRRR